MIKRKHLLTCCLSVSIIAGYAQKTYVIRETVPAKNHYKNLWNLSIKADPLFAWMDTIKYPRKEVATSTLAATMLRTVYLIEDVPELLAIQKYPANSSDQTRKELEMLLEFQKKRTDENISRYRKLAGIFHSPSNFNPLDPDYDRNFSSLFHVGSPLGNWYTYKNLPLTAKMMSNVYRDAMYYIFKLKVDLNRPRPYHLEPKLDALEKPFHQSYPSGHSSASFANAYIMMEIVPELSEEFLKMAEEMAISREYLGCHYPSDSEMGRLGARKFVNELLKKDKFIADFEKVKKEILDYRKRVPGKEGSKASAEQQVKCTGDSKSDSSSSCGSSCSSSCTSSCCKEN